MTNLAQHLVDALSAGSTYVLLGLGLSLVFSVMGLINFAYGALIVWAGYALVESTDRGLPYGVALVVMVAVVILLSVGMGRFAFRPFRAAPPSTLLLTSFGVALVLQAVAIALFGDRPRQVPTPDWLSSSLSIGGVDVSVLQLVTVGAGALVLVALHLVLTRTRLGLQIRSVAEDGDVSRLLGINSQRVLTTVFVLSGAIATVVAFLWLAKVGTVDPRADLNPTLKAFIVVVIGGLGTIRGAVIGGLLLGLFETFLAAYLPSSMTSYQQTLVFLILAAILVLRPQGIAGRVVEVSK